jgi:hypothetical protein
MKDQLLEAAKTIIVLGLFLATIFVVITSKLRAGPARAAGIARLALPEPREAQPFTNRELTYFLIGLINPANMERAMMHPCGNMYGDCGPQ